MNLILWFYVSVQLSVYFRNQNMTRPRQLMEWLISKIGTSVKSDMGAWIAQMFTY